MVNYANTEIKTVVLRSIKDSTIYSFQGSTSKEKCSNGQLIRSKQKNLLNLDNLSFSTILPSFSLQTIKRGVNGFGLATFCKDETLMLWAFFDNLIQNQTPGTIIQAAFNIIKKRSYQKRNKESLTAFFSVLGSLFNLKLPSILSKMLKQSELTKAKDDFSPVFFNTSVVADEFPDETDMRSLSSHPAHGQFPKISSLTPSALIPFCSFATNLSITGTEIPGIDFPICNSFKPVILDGRVCHQFDNSRISMEMKAGKEKGLMFVVDSNIEKALEIVDDEANSLTYKTLSLGKGMKGARQHAQIHINTLAPFYGEDPGDYAISSLKKMTGTQNFLALSNSECQNEDFVRCKNRNFFDHGKLLCGNCIPWVLQNMQDKIKVNSELVMHSFLMHIM